MHGAAIPAVVEIFPLEVTEQLERGPEMEQRERRWVPLEDVGGVVDEPEMEAIIRNFSPDPAKAHLPR